MKILTPILLAATLAIPAIAFACDDHPRHKHSLVKKLDKIVDLTDAQKAQIRELKVEDKPPMHHQIMREIAHLDPASATYQTDLGALASNAADQARERIYHMAERSQEIKALLTEEQIAKLNAFHAEKSQKQNRF